MGARRWLAVLLVPALTGAGDVSAEVLSKARDGFVVAHDIVLHATPDQAFRALTADVAAWWDARHSYSGDAANFTLEAQAGGCFCEWLPDGGSVEHMRVTFAAPGKRLRMTGGLGPLQGMGAGGTMEFAFEPEADGRTRLAFRYSVSGYAPEGLDAMADPVDRVLGGQLERLAGYLERQR